MIRRAAYRFVCIYLGLFSVASQFLGGLILFPGFSFRPLGTVWPMRPITEWLGTHVFHVSTLAVAGTSADTPFHWVQLSWIVVVSAIAAIASTVRLKADTTGASWGHTARVFSLVLISTLLLWVLFAISAVLDIALGVAFFDDRAAAGLGLVFPTTPASLFFVLFGAIVYFTRGLWRRVESMFGVGAASESGALNPVHTRIAAVIFFVCSLAWLVMNR